MKKTFVFVVVALLLVSCGGNSPDTVIPVTGGEGDTGSPSSSRGPVFDFSFYWQTDGPIENGMREIGILIVPHNIGKDYFDLDLGPFGDPRCEWDPFGDNDLSRPVLTTKEGYIYEPYAPYTNNAYCYRREVEFIPPGAQVWVFEMVNEGYVNAYIKYQIPENATPDSISLNYEYLPLNGGQREAGSYTGNVEPSNFTSVLFNPDPGVIDLYDLGDTVSIGDLAGVQLSAQSVGGSTYSVSLAVTNHHQGYPLTVEKFSSIVWFDTTYNCCYDYGSNWTTQGGLGPLQTAVFQKDFDLNSGFSYAYLFVNMQVSVNGGEKRGNIFAFRIPLN